MIRILTLLTIVALTPACAFGPVHVDTDELTFADPADAVLFSVASGDASVRTADVDEIVVRRTFHFTGSRPEARAEVVDGTLDIQVSCREIRLGRCSVDHEILLPASASVLGDTGSGDVTIAGLDHQVEVSTGSGDVQVTDVTGDLDLSTGSGDIVGERLVSDRVVADTGSGDVALDIEAQPRLVDIDTGSGDVDLGVSEGRYHLQLDTGSGDETIRGVTPDPRADATLRVHTGSGDVLVRGR